MTSRPCHIVFQGMAGVEAAKVEVHAWLERLGPLTIRMTGGKVVIEAIDERRVERRYRVRMELVMPEQVVMIEHDDARNAAHEDVHVAIRNAFRAVKAPLQAYCLAHPAPVPVEAEPAPAPLQTHPIPVPAEAHQAPPSLEAELAPAPLEAEPAAQPDGQAAPTG